MSDEQDQELAVTAPGHLRQEYIRCGKARCKKCNPPEGTPATGHGPYWYRYIWAGGKQRKRYVGKTLPQAVQTRLELVPTSPDEPEPATPAVPKTAEVRPVLGTVPKTDQPAGEPVTSEEPPAVPKTPTPRRGARINVNSVRMERGDLGRWRVVAGSKRRPVVVGFLQPVTGLSGRTKGWKALTDELTPIAPHMRPYKTRQEALVRLVDEYLHADERS